MVSKILRIKTKNQDIALIKKGNKYLCLEVSKVRNDKWITVKPHGDEEKGRHLLLKGDETPKEAMERQWGVDVDKKKEIEKKNKRETQKSKKSFARETSDSLYSEYKKAKEEKDKSWQEWSDEEEKLVKFARSKGLGLYDAAKIYPDKQKYEDSIKKRDEANEHSRELFINSVNKISANIKNTLKEYSSSTDEMVKSFSSIPDKVKEGHEKYKKVSEEADKIREEYKNGKLSYEEYIAQRTQKIGELTTILIDNKAQEKEQLFENLKYLNTQKTNFKLKYKTDSMQQISQELSTALDGFIGDGIVPDTAQVQVRNKKGRASEGGGIMNLDATDTLDVAIHEYMHFVEEQNPRILMNSLAFAKMRTGEEKTEPLSKLTGNKSYKGEYAKKDGFFDPYCGRIYNPQDGYNSYDGATASEIMSMGLQYIVKNPKKFAEEDREYFDFVIANIRGDI